MFEGVMSKVMKTIADGLRESDRMFMKLEEKRIEMKAQQKREKWQFQLQLAQLFAGQPSTHSEFQSPPYYISFPNPFYGSQHTPYYRGTEDNGESNDYN